MTATMTRTEVVSTAPAAPLGTGAFVTSQRGVTIDALLHQHMSWIRLPGSYLNLINQIQQLTRWSFRDLGDVLGTSHTTVGKLANGALPTTRTQEAAERLEPLLEVLSRISAVTTPGRELADVLGSGTGSGDRPLDHLEQAEWAQAYVVALDVINGPRPTRPQLRRPQAPRLAATRELL